MKEYEFRLKFSLQDASIDPEVYVEQLGVGDVMMPWSVLAKTAELPWNLSVSPAQPLKLSLQQFQM
jgi:hypothetical protein